MESLLGSWTLHLRACRKSPKTIETYGQGVRRFLAWCAETGTEPVLDRRTVDAFVAGLLDAGAEGTTARVRQMALRRFSAWLVDEEELDRDELLGIKPPQLDVKVLEPLTDDELVALIAACKGKGFRDRRDEAIVRTMAETIARSEETLSMTVSGTDPREGVAIIERGKGGKGRRVPFGPQTGIAIDRYLRARRSHRLADTDTLWLGDQGKGFGYPGLRRAMLRRAEAAGIEDFHLHRLRGTGATRWRRKGGSESGLMTLGGWTRLDMVRRYTDFAASELATEEARGLGLGDL